ncbi:MAG: hypothetical protein HYZ52_02120 [Candidatus Omnitrophica bacterium]|nr:hypothetical protein [Candidatus Omnitrophota bacterium]
MTTPEKWYFKTSAVVVAFLAVGPLALPLVWFNPRYDKRTKAIVTVAAAIATWLMGAAMLKSFQAILNYYHELKSSMN